MDTHEDVAQHPQPRGTEEELRAGVVGAETSESVLLEDTSKDHNGAKARFLKHLGKTAMFVAGTAALAAIAALQQRTSQHRTFGAAIVPEQTTGTTQDFVRASPARHTVAGHQRSQSYGERNALKKTIIVDPYIRGN